MPEDYNLDAVIEDSLTDAILPEEPVEVSPEVAPEVEPEVAAAEAAVADTAVTEPEGTDKPKKENYFDDFDKKFGIDQQYPSGRENRIPYSRVKKIAQKAVRDARKDWEAENGPKSQEWDTSKANYEKELGNYRNFEKTMVQEPEKFLRMLSSIPVYQQFFSAIDEAFDLAEKHKAGAAKPQVQAPEEQSDGMPQPDIPLQDGSLVYSEKQLRAMQAWNREQARKETLAEVDKRYGPIEAEWQARQRVESLKPKVNAQIADARTWDLFSENEAEIVNVLKNNPNISLEGAYRKVVLPKMKSTWDEERNRLVPERNKMREELLQEFKQAPRSTSVPSSASKSVVDSGTGIKSLEQIISESIKTLK